MIPQITIQPLKDMVLIKTRRNQLTADAMEGYIIALGDDCLDLDVDQGVIFRSDDAIKAASYEGDHYLVPLKNILATFEEE